jgi:16S rRNA (cytosine967-C5)-methyltransferase
MYSEFTLVSQAVEAAKRDVLMKAQAPFINACLRRFFRERDALIREVQDQPEALWNYPSWWIRRVREQYPKNWERILEVGNLAPPLTLRVNLSRTSRAELAKSWTEKGLAFTEQGEQGLVLSHPLPVHDIPGFDAGLCSVQDAGAQLAAQILVKALQTSGLEKTDPPASAVTGRGSLDGTSGAGPKRLKVLDACAAPGGKTTHLLEYPGLEVTALEVDEARCEKVRESCERLGVQADVVCADASDLSAWWNKEPFDAVLLDAPCTASGIVRRHPDIRWLRRESDIAQLGLMQQRLLAKSWEVLARGGYLLYCTCSIFRQEGELQIQAFLTRNTDAVICTQPGHLLPTAGGKGSLVTDNELNDHDGFFYALLQKK